MKREIRICADDFGLNECVNAGILTLATHGRLSSASCLVDGPVFEQGIAALQASGIEVGLHLNFTESLAPGETIWSLRTTIARSLARLLPTHVIMASIERQLQRFEDVAGHPPHYIDGHQHVQQLPQIRNALLAIALRRYSGADLPWLRQSGGVRSAGFPVAIRIKAGVIAVLGAGAYRRAATAAGFAMNRGFGGVYDFRGGQDAYLRWLTLWLEQSRTGDALMCHPALGVAVQDPLGVQRQAEFAVLSSEAMTRILHRTNIRIAGRDRS